MTDIAVIETKGLGKSYGKIDAIQNLNLSVRGNSITAFLGLNGAGKSTTIKMLLGMISPDSGGGRVLGKRIGNPADSIAMRQNVAYVSEHKRLYDYMTVEQMIRFTRSFYSDWHLEQEQELLRQYRLPLDCYVKSLSKGMRTKLALLLAFARRPELLILDEPSEGLDPIGIELLLESLMAHCREGTTVFFSSHQIPEVERVADHVCILHEGRLVLDASMDELRQSYRQIDLVFPSLPAEATFQMPGVESVRTSGHQMSIFVSSNTESVVERAHDLFATSIEVAPVGLREIFLQTIKENHDALV